MGSYRIRDQSKTHFVTFTLVNWVDLFTRQVYKELIVENLNYCIQQKGLSVFAYVIMSNHIHFIIQSKNANLSNIIRDFKKFTSKAIVKLVKSHQESRGVWLLQLFRKPSDPNGSKEKYQVWQHGYHAEEVYSTTFLWTKLDYIHLNPVRAGIVEKAFEYIYSSAKNYFYGEGFVQVDCVDNPIIDTHKNNAIWKSISW